MSVANSLALVGAGIMGVPVPDYLQPSSFGSLERKPRAESAFVGHPIDYSKTSGFISIDALALPRVDLIKLDIEGIVSGATTCAPSWRSTPTRLQMPASIF